MSGIAVVVFDWYATLASPNPTDFWTRLPELLSEAGGVIDQDALHEWDTGHPLDHAEFSSSEAVYRRFQRHRFEVLLEQCAVPEPGRTELLERVESERYSRTFSVFADAVEVLRELRDESLRVGICSNWDWDLDRHLRFNEIHELVDFVVCSAVVGYRKPHPGIFDQVLAHAGAPADQILFVGDSWVDDVGGAVEAGMQAVHVSTGTSCAEIDHERVPCVASLRDVVQHVMAN